MIRNITLITALVLVQILFGQNKSRADRYFEKADYIKAAKYYEEELIGINHKKTVTRIATCYYNVFDYKMASLYLKKLVTGRFIESDKTYANQYNFMYYQMLSALGDYDLAFTYLKLYNDNLETVIDQPKYLETIEEIKLKSPDFLITEVPFNSENSDFGAVKLKDSVYFTSDRKDSNTSRKTYKWTHRPFLDIYALKVNDKIDSVGIVSPLPKIINSKLHEGNFCFSKDGNTIYISRSNYTNGKKEFNADSSNNIHLYVSKKEKGVWTEPTKLPFNIKGYSYQHPALSPDGTRLYFSSNQEGGFGSFDIYYVTISGADYGTPINLGEQINTPNREHFPFIAEGNHLFFSSNGHLGLGMLDIFVSENKNDTLTTPINLGVPINSRYDDFNLNYYDNVNGFFASNRNNVNDDIFKFEQIGEIFLKEYVTIFEVRDKLTNKMIPNSKVSLFDKNNKKIYENTLTELASFNQNLFPDVYIFKAESEGYLANELRFRVIEQQDQGYILYLEKAEVIVDPVVIAEEEEKKKEEVTRQTAVKKSMLSDKKGPPIVEKDGKLVFKLEPIYFDYDMWNIRADSKKILDELAKKLERYPTVQLKINAHTDNRGTDRYNQILSEKRAESTRNYLALEGFVNACRLQFQGMGEGHPEINCNEKCSEKQHQLNRRSEFEIVKY